MAFGGSGNARLDAQGSTPGRTNGRENYSPRFNTSHSLSGNRPPNRHHQRNNARQGHSSQQNDSFLPRNSGSSNYTRKPPKQQNQQTRQPNARFVNPSLHEGVSPSGNAQEGVGLSSRTTGRMEPNGRPGTARRGRGDVSSRGRGKGAFGATSGGPSFGGNPFGGGSSSKPTSGRGGRGGRGGARGGRGGYRRGSPAPSGGEESDDSGDEGGVARFTDSAGSGNGENPRDKNAAKSVRAERFSDQAPTMALFEKMKKDRVRERRDAIANGTIDDPDVPKRLEDALDFVGTCMDMCPEFERVERSVQHSVDPLELDPRTGEIDRNYAVKRFHRPAAGNDAQLPSDVRPPKVLVSTLAYLVYDLCSGDVPLSKTHPFVRDRTRAIRQDFTLQNYRKAETVQCHEIIARFHILSLHKLAKDTPDHFVAQQEIEQLQKTLTTLMELYEDARLDGYNYDGEAEFRSYQILAHIRDPDLQRQAQRWPSHIFGSAPVQMALKFFALIQANNRKQTSLGTKNTESCFNNFGTFFRLVKSKEVSYLMACLLETHFSEVRKYALKAMRGVYRRDSKQILLKFVQKTLAYEDETSLMVDCDNYGLSYSLTDPDPGQEPESYLVIHKGNRPWTDNLPTKQSFHQFVEAKLMGRSISDVLWEPKGGAMSNETRAQLLLNHAPHQRTPDPRALAPQSSPFALTPQNGVGFRPLPKLPNLSGKPGFGLLTLSATAQAASGAAPTSKPLQPDGIQSFCNRGSIMDSAFTQGFSGSQPTAAVNTVFGGVQSNSSVFNNVPQQFPTAGSLAAGAGPFAASSTGPPRKNPFGHPTVGPLKFATGTSSTPTPTAPPVGFNPVTNELAALNSQVPSQPKPPPLGDLPRPVQPAFGPVAIPSNSPVAPSATASVFQPIADHERSLFSPVAPQPSAQSFTLGSSLGSRHSGSASFLGLFQKPETPPLFDSSSAPASVNGGSVFDSLQNSSRSSPASFVFPTYVPDDTRDDDELADNVATQPYTGTPSSSVLNNSPPATSMSSLTRPFSTGDIDQGSLFASSSSGSKQNSAVPSNSNLAQPSRAAAPELPHHTPTNKLFHSPARITELADSLFDQLLEKKTKEVIQDVMESNKAALAESIVSDFLDIQAWKIATNIVQEAIATNFQETRLKEKMFVPWKRMARKLWLKRLRQERLKNPPPPIPPQWHPVQFPDNGAPSAEVHEYINRMFKAPPLAELFHPKVEYAFWATSQKREHPIWRLLIVNTNSEDTGSFWWKNKFLGQGMPRKAISDKATFEAQFKLEQTEMGQVREIGGFIFGCSAAYNVPNEERFKRDRRNLHDAVKYMLDNTSFQKLAIAIVCYRSPLDTVDADPFGEPDRTSGEGREKRLAAIREALGLNEFGSRVIGQEIILVETFGDIDFTPPMKRLSGLVMESVNPAVAEALAPKSLKRKRIPHPPMFANLVVPPPLNRTPKNEKGDGSTRPKRRKSTPPDRHTTAGSEQMSYIDCQAQKLDWVKSTGGALSSGVRNPVGEEILVTARAPIQPTTESEEPSPIASLSAEIEDVMNITRELDRTFDVIAEDFRELAHEWMRLGSR